MLVEKVEIGNFLTAQFVREQRLTELKIADGGKMIKFDAKDRGEVEKISLGIDYRGKRTGDPDAWALNNKSRNSLIDIFGMDTSRWVGRVVGIKLEGSGEYEYILVDVEGTRR